jgi:hypothetical protein
VSDTLVTPRLATHARKRVDTLARGERVWFRSAHSWEIAQACGPATESRGGAWLLSVIDESTGSGATLYYGSTERAPFAFLAKPTDRGWNTR